MCKRYGQGSEDAVAYAKVELLWICWLQEVRDGLQPGQIPDIDQKMVNCEQRCPEDADHLDQHCIDCKHDSWCFMIQENTTDQDYSGLLLRKVHGSRF